MESRVIALEECLKETEKRLDAVDQKVDEAFEEAEDIRKEGKGTCSYRKDWNLREILRRKSTTFRIIARRPRTEADSQSFPDSEVISRHKGRVQVACQ